MRQIVVIAHDVRSAHNIGSLFRTCEGLGVKKLYLTGYTPYPAAKKDERLPHLKNKIDSQIARTSLGAEKSLPWEHKDDLNELTAQLKSGGFEITTLEQTKKSTILPDYSPGSKVALIVGNEVKGLDERFIKIADVCIEIPMMGKKESFNVVQAAAMALYHMTFIK